MPIAETVEIRPMQAEDAPLLANAFADIGWDKPVALFQSCLAEADAGRLVALAAVVDGVVAGYVTVQWTSDDPVFAGRDVPEIRDLNVLPHRRGSGVGTALLDAAEAAIAERAVVAGIRVGLHSGYGAAQRLYVRRGYVPDGAGAIDGSGRGIAEGAAVALDDDVTIRLTKVLGRTA